jgi:putative membrane protein
VHLVKTGSSSTFLNQPDITAGQQAYREADRDLLRHQAEQVGTKNSPAGQYLTAQQEISHMERRSFLLALGALSLGAGVAQARPGMVADFRTADLAGGAFAMTTSQLALTRTGNPDIINFANAEIAEQMQVAAALGAAPGSAPMRTDHAVLLRQLQAVPSGGGFDRMYVQGQIRGHRELLALNSSYLRSVGDPQEQGIAQMSLPIIQRHLAILNGLREMA